MRPSKVLQQQRDQVLALALAAWRGAARVRVFGSVASSTDHDASDADLSVDMLLLGVQTKLLDADR